MHTTCVNSKDNAIRNAKSNDSGHIFVTRENTRLKHRCPFNKWFPLQSKIPFQWWVPEEKPREIITQFGYSMQVLIIYAYANYCL